MSPDEAYVHDIHANLMKILGYTEGDEVTFHFMFAHIEQLVHEDHARTERRHRAKAAYYLECIGENKLANVIREEGKDE